jgi:P pilus assembly chaperone PapD
MRSPEVNRLSLARVTSFITIGLIAFLILCPLSASAFKVTGSRYIGNISPGSSAVHTMMVNTNPDDPPMDFIVEVLGFGQTPQQNLIGLSAEQDTSPYSARTFITVIPKTFHLAPGASQEVKATITVPPNVGDGGRYAILNIHNAPIGNGTMAIITAIAVPVAITVNGKGTTLTGSITDLMVADLVPGQPIKITTSVKNTGNYFYKVKNDVSVTDKAGKMVATAGINESMSSIIPPFTQNYDVTFVTPLPPGIYTVTSTITRDDGTVLDTKTAPLEMKAAYVPPSDEATVPLSPKSSTVLKTTDGRFTVNFPAGAVLSEANVTLKPFSNDKLPAAPEGAKLGATSFRIDGLTGLLSKDATVVVKYSSADLEAAGSDVSKLTLARFDESEGKWTIVPTTVDRNALTLTATTNRFSIWVVMAANGGTSGGTGSGSNKPGLALDPTLVFAALGLMIAFMGIQGSRKR